MADDYEPNALGITGSVVLGFTGLDAYKDIGDIAYGIYNWEWTWSHAGMMAFNLVSLAPVIGAAKSLKYADEVLDGVENTADTVKLVNKCDAPKGGASFFDDLAMSATRNADSTKLVLGKWSTTGQSYQKVAAHYKATYFKLENWRELSKTLSDKELWKINEAFLRQQIKQGKQIILSHDPSKATGFFKNEVDFLSKFYRFEKDGWVWKAIPK